MIGSARSIRIISMPSICSASRISRICSNSIIGAVVVVVMVVVVRSSNRVSDINGNCSVIRINSISWIRSMSSI